MRTVVLLLALVAAPLHAIADTPTGGGGGLRRDCATNQILKWSGTTWLCSTDLSGVTNAAGANVVTKSNGTNLVASSITDNGSIVTVGNPLVTASTLDASAAAVTVGDLRGSEVTDSQTGTVHNLSVSTTATILRLTTTGIVELTGITGGQQGRRLTVINAGPNLLKLYGEFASSTAANRFATGNGSPLWFRVGDGFVLEYSGSRWHIVAASHDILNNLEVVSTGVFDAGVNVAGDLAANGNASFGDANTDKLFSRANVYSVTTSSAANKPAVTSCGTSPGVVGGSLGFNVTVGSGSPTACTVTFATAFDDVPACTITRIGGTTQQWFQWSTLSASAGTFQACNSTACGGNALTNSYSIHCVGTSINPGSP